MSPLDPVTGPEPGGSPEPGTGPRASEIIPTQAVAHGGTFVRPGAIAWGGVPGPAEAPPLKDSGEVVEKALAAMTAGGHPNDLLDELARARVWVPLPGGAHPVTDGSAVALPVLLYLGAEFVPCFTSAERLARYTGRRRHRAADPRRIPHIVVPAAALARLLPPGLGMALNPNAETSVPIYPEGVAHLAGRRDEGVRVGHPPIEPDTVLAEVARTLRRLPPVVSASRAWLSVPGTGEGLVLSVTLEDPAAEAAHAAVIEAIEQAVGRVPGQPGYPIDVTFPGEAAPDIIDVWVADNTSPFYVRDPAV